MAEDQLFLKGFPRLGRLARSVVTVLFAGRARLTAGGRTAWLEAGDIALLSDKHQISMRQDGRLSYQSLVLEWDDGALGERLAGFEWGRLGARELLRLRQHANEIFASGEPARAATLLSEVLGLLRANGLPLDGDRVQLDEPVPMPLRIVARALDRCLSELDAQPMLVDLVSELGLGERQVQRLVTELNDRFGFNAGNWRDTLLRRRVMLGVNLMTAGGATTERVARAVGYSSAAAFCRALAQHDLPAPGAIAPTVAALG